jgi:hypothetical protein
MVFNRTRPPGTRVRTTGTLPFVRPRLLLLLAPLLIAGSIGCTSTLERVDDLRTSTTEMSETARFCLTLARAVAAYETGSPRTAADAVEELLVQAPPEVRDDAREVVEALRRAQDGDRDALADAEVQAAIDRLRATTEELCDPTS